MKEGGKLPELLKICVISPTLKVAAAISYRFVSALLRAGQGAAGAAAATSSVNDSLDALSFSH